MTTEPHPNVRDLVENVPLEMAECLSLLMAKSASNRPRDGIEAAQLLQAVAGQIRDIESLLTEAFPNRSDVVWRREGKRYRLDLLLPDGRRQVLFVETSDHSTAERLLLIYSVCCEAESEYYEDALRLNAEMSHGGLSIRDIDGRQCFVMVDSRHVPARHRIPCSRCGLVFVGVCCWGSVELALRIMAVLLYKAPRVTAIFLEPHLLLWTQLAPRSAFSFGFPVTRTP